MDFHLTKQQRLTELKTFIPLMSKKMYKIYFFGCRLS